MTIPSIRNDTGCLAALWRTAIFLKNAPSCSAVNAMRSSAESCGGIGFFGHSTFVQPQAVVTSIRTSGCFEVLVARRETWRVVPSRTSPSDSIERSNLSASSVSTSGLSKSTVCSNAARFSSAGPAEGFGGPPQAIRRIAAKQAAGILCIMRICSGLVSRGYRARRWRAYCRASFGTVTTWRRWPVGSRPARHGCSCRAGTYGSANRQG